MNYLEKWLDVPKVILQYVQLKLHTEKNLVHVCSYSLHVLLILSPMRYTKEIYYACKTRHSYSYSLFALSLNMKQYFFSCWGAAQEMQEWAGCPDHRRVVPTDDTVNEKTRLLPHLFALLSFPLLQSRFHLHTFRWRQRWSSGTCVSEIFWQINGRGVAIDV